MDTVKVGPLGQPGMPYDGPWMAHLRGSSATSASRMPCQVYSCSRDDDCHACNWPGRWPGRCPAAAIGAVNQFLQRYSGTQRPEARSTQRRGADRARQAPISSQFANRNLLSSPFHQNPDDLWHLRGGNTRRSGSWCVLGPACGVSAAAGSQCSIANSIVENKRALHRLMPGFFVHLFVLNKQARGRFILPAAAFQDARPW